MLHQHVQLSQFGQFGGDENPWDLIFSGGRFSAELQTINRCHCHGPTEWWHFEGAHKHFQISRDFCCWGAPGSQRCSSLVLWWSNADMLRCASSTVSRIRRPGVQDLKVIKVEGVKDLGNFGEKKKRNVPKWSFDFWDCWWNASQKRWHFKMRFQTGLDLVGRFLQRHSPKTHRSNVVMNNWGPADRRFIRQRWR